MCAKEHQVVKCVLYNCFTEREDFQWSKPLCSLGRAPGACTLDVYPEDFQKQFMEIASSSGRSFQGAWRRGGREAADVERRVF